MRSFGLMGCSVAGPERRLCREGCCLQVAHVFSLLVDAINPSIQLGLKDNSDHFFIELLFRAVIPL